MPADVSRIPRLPCRVDFKAQKEGLDSQLVAASEVSNSAAAPPAQPFAGRETAGALAALPAARCGQGSGHQLRAVGRARLAT